MPMANVATGDVIAAVSTKVCSKCGSERPLADFPRAARKRDGLSAWCRRCHAAYFQKKYAKNKQYFWDKSKRWYADNPIRARLYHVRRQFGVTEEQYVSLLERQHHRCAICGAALGWKPAPSVDHDHVTGLVRGLLCGSCNTVLGLAHDDIGTLLAAAEYLSRSRGGSS